MEAFKLQPLRNNNNISRSRYYDEDKRFLDFVREYLAKSHRSDRYKRMYLNTLDHIEGYCELNGLNIQTLYTDSLDMEFCENFVHYLQSDRNLMQNTVKGHLERMQAMIQKAMLYGYYVNNSYKEVHVPEEEVGAVFLTYWSMGRSTN